MYPMSQQNFQPDSQIYPNHPPVDQSGQYYFLQPPIYFTTPQHPTGGGILFHPSNYQPNQQPNRHDDPPNIQTPLAYPHLAHPQPVYQPLQNSFLPSQHFPAPYPPLHPDNPQGINSYYVHQTRPLTHQPQYPPTLNQTNTPDDPSSDYSSQFYNEQDLRSKIENIAKKNGLAKRMHLIDSEYINLQSVFKLKLKLDLSHHKELQPSRNTRNVRDQTVSNNKKVQQYILNLLREFKKDDSKFVLTEVDLSRNLISGRALFEKSLGRYVLDPFFLENLTEINFSSTNISHDSLKHFSIITKELKNLWLDSCKNITSIPKASPKYISKVQMLSIVDTPCWNTKNVFKYGQDCNINHQFPKFSELYITQQTGKYAGIYDPITDKCAINPRVYSCGDVFGEETEQFFKLSLDLRKKKRKCPIGKCSKKITSSVELKFPITRITRDHNNKTWIGEVVGYDRKPLPLHNSHVKGRIYYHPECGHLFSSTFFEDCYGKSKTADELIKKVTKDSCPGCHNLKPLNLKRIYLSKKSNRKSRHCDLNFYLRGIKKEKKNIEKQMVTDVST